MDEILSRWSLYTDGLNYQIDDEVTKRTLFGGMKTTLEMLLDRGYVIDEILSHWSSYTDVLITAHVAEQLVVVFLVNDIERSNNVKDVKMGVKDLRNYLKIVKQMVVDMEMASGRIILLHRTTLTSFSKTIIDQHRWGHEDGIIMEAWNLHAIQRNITRHRYVPTHRLMTPEERAKFLENNTVSNLPKHSVDDCISRYYWFKPDDLIYVYRTIGNLTPKEVAKIVKKI